MHFILFILFIRLIHALSPTLGSTAQPANPFRPGFGESPTVWSGRGTILESYRRAIETDAGSPGRMLLINGARGIGKTALLNELEDIARTNGWVLLRASSNRNMLGELIDTTIPEKINSLRGEPGRRISGASIAGIGSVRTEQETEDIVTPSLSSQLRRLADFTEAHQSGILITMDEVQAADADDIGELATAVQNLVRDDIGVSFIGAGLTSGIQDLLNAPGTTFLRRSQRYQLAPLKEHDAVDLLVRTSEPTDVAFSAASARHAAEAVFGYPYLLQLIGSLAWRASSASRTGVITSEAVSDAVDLAVPALGSQVHEPELSRMSFAQFDFLRAMATLMDEQPAPDHTDQVRIRAVADQLHKPVTSLSRVRAALIERDIVHSPSWGTLAFRLPYLREFLDSPGDRPRSPEPPPDLLSSPLCRLKSSP